MSKTVPPRPIVIDGKRTFIIVASQFNTRYVEGLVDHAKQELHVLAPNAAVSVQRVPGAFEIPVVVGELASKGMANALIACGVILKGKTDHAQNLSRSVTDALQRVAIGHGVPVINAVLSFDNETHARDRCLGNEINRGTEAARAAVEIANVMSKLRGK
ncbi:MAG: 6,7-dimethyl-8-ribityllumazine synthase [Verrucomicrobia bacterium]|nr:MAG: 6,7-dimethyl-8-ribityllumazine synthase [Verrucomicrobiota bacterium]